MSSFLTQFYNILFGISSSFIIYSQCVYGEK